MKLDMENSFGQFLRANREAAKMTQEQLANGITSRGYNCVKSYISNIERGSYKKKRPGDSKPNENLVIAAAETLGGNVDEFLIAAGYAPRSLTQGRPESLPELIAVLERAGISHIEFADADRLQAASPEELRDVIDSVSLALEIALARLKRKEATTDAPHPALPPRHKAARP